MPIYVHNKMKWFSPSTSVVPFFYYLFATVLALPARRLGQLHKLLINYTAPQLNTCTDCCL